MTPLLNPSSLFAFVINDPNTVPSTNPKLTTCFEDVAGLPTTILSAGIPLFIIYWTDVPVKSPPDEINNWLSVVYNHVFCLCIQHEGQNDVLLESRLANSFQWFYAD